MSATKAAGSLTIDQAWHGIVSGDATKYVSSLKLLCEADPAAIGAGFRKLELEPTLAALRHCLAAPDTAEVAMSVADALVCVLPSRIAARLMQGFHHSSASGLPVGSLVDWLVFLNIDSKPGCWPQMLSCPDTACTHAGHQQALRRA